jgi:hypothetical protein
MKNVARLAMTEGCSTRAILYDDLYLNNHMKVLAAVAVL